MNTMEVDEKIVAKWQSIVDTLAELIQVPAGLIMRISGPDIEVFVADQTEGNPYHPGERGFDRFRVVLRDGHQDKKQAARSQCHHR